jgi:hypothetical protein
MTETANPSALPTDPLITPEDRVAFDASIQSAAAERRADHAVRSESLKKLAAVRGPGEPSSPESPVAAPPIARIKVQIRVGNEIRERTECVALPTAPDFKNEMLWDAMPLATLAAVDSVARQVNARLGFQHEDSPEQPAA